MLAKWPTSPARSGDRGAEEHCEHLLFQLLEPLRKAALDCPACGLQSPLAPPFDLGDLRCPVCRAQLYPFAQVEGGLVDLRELRELIAVCHIDPASARELLLQLRVREDTGLPIEPTLYRPALVAHAIWAYLRWREPSVPWWAPLLAVLHPTLGCVALGWACWKREERRAYSLRLLETSLASERFDPCRLDLQATPSGLADVIEQLQIESSWPPVLRAREFRGARVFAAREISSWSIAVEPQKRCAAGGGDASELSAAQFLEEVIAELLAKDAGDGVVRRDRTLLVLRPGSLDPRDPVPPTALEAQPLLEREPRLRSALLPYRIIETASCESGSVIWSCLRATQQGALIGVHCESFARRCAGRGARIGGRAVDPDAWLAAERDSRELVRQAGSRLERLAAAIPRGALTAALACAALLGTWLIFAQPALREALGAGTADQLGRLAALACAGALVLRHRAWRRQPFPAVFWAERQLGGLFGSRRRRRRRERLAATLQKLRGRFDDSAPAPLSHAASMAPIADTAEQQNEDFFSHAQDHALAQAVAEVAQRHGSAISRFRERGAQPIDHCCAIAGRTAASRGS